MTSLPSAVQSVLDLFKGPLSNVRFADIDAAGLANLAAEVEAAASEVEEQEEKLTELRQGLAQRQEALLVLAQRALAYARVYAENDEPLLEELSRIALPRAAKPAQPRAAKPRKAGATKGVGARGAHDASRAEAAASEAQVDDGGAAAEPIEEASSEPLETVEAAPVRGRKSKGRSAHPTAS